MILFVDYSFDCNLYFEAGYTDICYFVYGGLNWLLVFYLLIIDLGLRK